MVNRNIPFSLNAPLPERLKYAPDNVDLEMVAETMDRYEALLAVINDSDLNTCIELDDDPADVAKDIKQAIDDLLKRSIESMVDNPYRGFFDDCVGALGSFWPGASIEDENLKTVIIDAINRGEGGLE